MHDVLDPRIRERLQGLPRDPDRTPIDELTVRNLRLILDRQTLDGAPG